LKKGAGTQIIYSLITYIKKCFSSLEKCAFTPYRRVPSQKCLGHTHRQYGSKFTRNFDKVTVTRKLRVIYEASVSGNFK